LDKIYDAGHRSKLIYIKSAWLRSAWYTILQ
jgi:hypothetical protein